jgi:predicted amidohydrolase YtcJ
VNGEVVTLNPNDEVAEAVAVEGGRILAVGATEEILGLRGPRTRVVDLEGSSLLPGFIDAHLHMLLYGTNRLGVDCKNGVGSVEEMVDRLANRAAEMPGGEWVRCWGYNDQKLSEGRHPTRGDLDRVSTDHPVIAGRTCGHISAVNSKALELLGITRETPDPEGGKIERGTDGEPTRVLKEKAHMAAFQNRDTPPSRWSRPWGSPTTTSCGSVSHPSTTRAATAPSRCGPCMEPSPAAGSRSASTRWCPR